LNSKEISFFPYEQIQIKEYKNFLKLVTSNSLMKTSLPYIHFIQKIIKNLSKLELKKILSGVKRIRQLEIDQATKEILKFSA
jgi:hypothetical protein